MTRERGSVRAFGYKILQTTATYLHIQQVVVVACLCLRSKFDTHTYNNNNHYSNDYKEKFPCSSDENF